MPDYLSLFRIDDLWLDIERLIVVEVLMHCLNICVYINKNEQS